MDLQESRRRDLDRSKRVKLKKKQEGVAQMIFHDEKTPRDVTMTELRAMVDAPKVKPSFWQTMTEMSGPLVGGVAVVTFVDDKLMASGVAALILGASFSGIAALRRSKTFNMLLIHSGKRSIPERYLPYANFLKNKMESWDSEAIKDATIEKFEKKHPHKARPPMKAVQSHASNDGWASSLEVYRLVREEWFAAESDILTMVTYPLLMDLRDPMVREFHEKMAYAKQVTPQENDPFEISHPFIKAVASMEFSWKALLAEAKKVKDSSFEPEERKRLDKARDLLNIALNKASAPAERQSAYRRAMKELDGLLHVPENAVFALESAVGLKAIEESKEVL